MLNSEFTMFSLLQHPQAVQRLEKEIVSVLLDKGADLNVKNSMDKLQYISQYMETA